MGNKWILEGREGPVLTVQALEHLSWLAWVAVQWWPWWEEITDVVQRLVLFYSLQAVYRLYTTSKHRIKSKTSVVVNMSQILHWDLGHPLCLRPSCTAYFLNFFWLICPEHPTSAKKNSTLAPGSLRGPSESEEISTTAVLDEKPFSGFSTT
jgi:hypothetical protein